MQSIPFIQWCIENLNEWTIILLMTIESSFIPFPSEIVVPPAAYFGEVSLLMVIVCATIGADLGAIINYFLAQWIGRPIVYKFADSRIGHMCLLSSEKIAKAEAFFNKHGVISTLIGRLVPGVRQLISIPAGLARMNFGKFIFYTTIGAGIWNTILALIGYGLRSVVSPEQLNATVNEFSHYIKIGIWAVLGLIALFLVIRFFSHKKSAK
ncbi:MAG: DedA family protein [Bacteroidales bacterium]|nr:DedA family protein [Bacteroidales bacterium]